MSGASRPNEAPGAVGDGRLRVVVVWATLPREVIVKLGIAALRAIVGILFMGHGLQKLVGRFGGHGLEGTGAAFESMGLRPGKAHAAAAGTSETLGGALLAGGLLTPLGATLLSGTMLTAIRKVHLAKGVWVSNGGYEYNLVLLAVLFAVTDLGPGDWSLDNTLGTRRSGPGWAIAQLAAGAAGSAAAVAFGTRYPNRATPVSGGLSSQAQASQPREDQSDADSDGPIPQPSAAT
jgi:putative oxidoreductase